MEELINEHDPDVILCQETKLDSSIYSSEIFPSSFSVYRKDRTLHGGGVCIAVKNSYESQFLDDLDAGIEAVWVQLQNKNKQRLVIGSIYRPPNVHSTYVEDMRIPLSKILSPTGSKPPEIIIGGDFN